MAWLFAGRIFAPAVSPYELVLTKWEFFALELVYNSRVNRSQPIQRDAKDEQTGHPEPTS
jgi:hypothetical protein